MLATQEFLAAVGRVVTARLQGPDAPSFSRQHLSNLMWAYATVEKQPGSSMLDMVAKASLCPPSILIHICVCMALAGRNALWEPLQIKIC